MQNRITVLRIIILNSILSRNVEVSVQTEAKCQEGGADQSPETGKKVRTQKKRKEKPREGTSKNNIIIQPVV